MIKSIKITNFCSIGETQEISFMISKKDRLDDSSTIVDNKYLNLVNCFIGHNASGKTSVFKAVNFLFKLVNDSYFTEKEYNFGVRPHKLYLAKPTVIEMEFFNQGNWYKYDVKLDSKKIYKEYLGIKNTRGYTRIFEYERLEKDWDFNAPTIKINQSDFERFKKRENVSLLSSLIATGYITDLSFFKQFQSNVSWDGYYMEHPLLSASAFSQQIYHEKELQEKALRFIQAIDIGISEFAFESIKPVMSDEEKYFLKCIHQSESIKFELFLQDESNGTQQALHLLAKIIPVLETGGLVMLDEIDCALHPHVAKKIISLFENTETNPNHAQIMFSTHQHWLLNDRTKTQIFIIEKDNKKFETEVFRLDEIGGVRNDENYAQKYLAGTYGGVPNIKWGY